MSLTTCIRKAGEHLRPEDKAKILLRARELRGEGLRPDDAGVSAVTEQADAVQQMLDAAEAGLAQAKDASTQHQRAAEDKANAARQGDMFQEDFAGADDSVETARLVSSRGDTAPGGNINSAGQKISGTKQGLKNFWAWFGNSDAVDDKGRPLVMYHSTRGDISRFESGRATTNNYGLLGDAEVRRAGIFMTPDAGFSQEYLRSGDGQNVMQVYLKTEQPLDLRGGLSEADEAALEKGGISTRMVHNIQNHWELFDADDNGKSEFVDALRELGYDGAIFYEDRRNGGRAVTYMAFDPGQLKSATGNAGTFDASNPDITKSTERAWYSQLQSAIEQAPARLGDMAAAQWAQWLKANASKMGVKQDEITWSGIEDYLALRGKDKLSRDELAAWVGENGVKVEEVVLGESAEMTEDEFDEAVSEAESSSQWDLVERLKAERAKEQATKYAQYTLPGGTNYREVLLTLPELPVDTTGWTAKEGDGDPASGPTWEVRDARGKWVLGVPREGGRTAEEAIKRAAKSMRDNPSNYKSSHWDQPNVLAHIRVNDRTDADGKKVLFVEELQSDWQQQARKDGFRPERRGDEMPDGFTLYDDAEDARKSGIQVAADEQGPWFYKGPGIGSKIFRSREEAISAAWKDASGKYDSRPPRGPFVDKTESWLALALKRVIKMAVDGSSPGNEAWASVTKPQRAREEFEQYFGSELAAVLPLEVVDTAMLGATQNDQVRRAVVESVPVDVVDILAQYGVTPEQLVGEPDVVGKGLPVVSRPTVARGLADALALVGARSRAVLRRVLAGHVARRDSELDPAIRARDFQPDVVVRLLSSPGSSEARALGGSIGAAATRDRAEARKPVLDGAGESGKLSPAQLAEALNRHDAILRGDEGNVVTKFIAPSGYEKIAFITGEQSAERYDLSKQIDAVEYIPKLRRLQAWKDGLSATNVKDVGPEKLEDHIGKEAAKRLLESPLEGGRHKLSGLDLKVGGEGMKTFYDQIVPQVLRDVLKKVGGEGLATVSIKPARQDLLVALYSGGKYVIKNDATGKYFAGTAGWVDAGDRPATFNDKATATARMTELQAEVDHYDGHSQPGFAITDKMRERAADGLPLFSTYRSDPELESWAEAALTGQHTRDAYKKVAPALPHPAWLMAGLDGRLPVTIDRRLVSHLRRAGHEEVTAGMIGRLADLMAHPRVMIRNEDVDGNGQKITRHQALLDARDEQGRPLLVAVRQSKEGGGDVYDVRSMFGRNESMRYVLDQLRHGNVVWMADKEAAALRDFTGRGTMPRTGQKPGAQPARTATTVIVPGDAAAQNYPTKGWKQGGNSITVPADTRRADGVIFSAARDPQTETDAFKSWFGDSKVVDEQGKPLVVYHGTHDDFDEFARPGEFGDAGRHVSSSLGIFFAAKPETAEAFLYNDFRGGVQDGGHIKPVYLSIQKPFEMPWSQFRKRFAPRGSGSWEPGDVEWDRASGRIEGLLDSLARDGYDGIRIKGHKNAGDIEGVADTWVAFEPEQIKSAIGNSGSFDPNNADITKSGERAFDAPEPSRFDDLVYKMQDKQVDLKRVVAAVKATQGAIRDDLDAYLQEELFHGRAAKRTDDFVHHELQPLIDQMSEEGLQISDLDEYLHARHAREANEVIKRRNPEIQDGGSGMLNQDAEAYFAETDAAKLRKLEAAAAHVDRMLAKTRELLVDYQLESREKVQGWAEMFEHYVPLMREDEGDHSGGGTGQGFSIKGKEVKSRTGSTRKVVDILANIAMQRERTIVRGEKNRVSQALFGLAAANPNPGFWQVDTHIPREQVFNPKTGLVEDRPDNLYRQRPNVVVTKIADESGNVSERAVIFNEKNERAMRMAESLKNLDAAQLEGLLGASAKLTRYFASINTQYNPVFGVVNLVRDMQGALVNLGTTEIADKKADVARQAMSALRGIYGDLRATRKGGTASSPWAQLWEEFQSVGGQTGFRQLFATSNDRAEAIKSALDPTAWMDSKLGKIFTANGTLKVPLAAAQRGAKWIFDWLSDYNTAMENGVRLAAYKTAIDAGLSKERAASLAKNLTVNFNRKGQAAQQAGALYAFFNASAQGTARLGSVLFEMEPGKPKTARLSPLGKKVVYGGMMLGSMQAMALAAAGFGEDDPPEWARERALIIPTGNKTYVTIPLPLGLHVIPNIGRVTTAWALGGFKNTPEKLVGLVGSLADAFNPIGNAGLSMQTLAPTALDPLVALTENRDWSGRPITRESSNKATPGHALARDTASSWSKLLSEGINYLSGGTKYTAGALSPTPDQIDYLISQVTGGVGRELSKVEQSAKGAVSGESVPLYKVPLVGRFVGNAKSQASEGNAFYANVEKLNEIETEIKGLRKDGKTAEASAVRLANPMAYLITQANHAERQVQKLRREKSELVKAGAPREQIAAIEAKITERMAALNRAVEKLKAD